MVSNGDIVPRKMTEGEAIARGQAAGLSQAITKHAADGLYVTDSDGSIRYVNESGLRMLGYEADELIGCDSHAALHHCRLDGTPIPVEDRPLVGVRTGSATHVTTDANFARKDGSLLAVVYSSSPVQLAGGMGSVVVFRDVSAQRATYRHSEALHRTLIANLPDASVFLIDHELRILVAAGEAMTRLPWFSETMFRGRKVTELRADAPSDLVDLSVEHYRAALLGERRAFEFDSEGMTFAVQAVPVRAEDGSVEAALVVASDITQRTRAARRLARHVLQHNAVSELGRFALETHNLNMLMTVAVACATATLGVEVAGVLELDADGEALTLVASVGVSEQVAGKVAGSLADRPISGHIVRTGEPVFVEDWATETRFASPSALLERGFVSTLAVKIDGRNEPFGVLYVHACEPHAISEDDVGFLERIAALITAAAERNREEQVTRHEAMHDALTGLPNRTLALDRVAQALARRRREGIDVVVFVLDVDRFKMINDSYGHAVGDEVLLAVAPRLTAAVRPSDTVARLGGDEFVVIFAGGGAARQATEVAERLAAAVSKSLVLDSGNHSLTVSIGITVSASPHDTPGSLLRDADVAMYRAKESGRGRYELFDEAMRAEVMTRLRTETELRRALDGGEFQVWYQPMIDLATGLPISTEALVRWEHPERGLTAPLEFIHVAEEIGLIGDLGLAVLERACNQTATWQHQFDTSLGVSVNISGRQAINPRFPAEAASIAQRSELRERTLTLEITESVLMEEADSPTAILGSMQDHGLTVALDDFGTGYSSLSRLKRFPLDVLKIDRSFIAGVDSNVADRAIVKATIDMAHAVGLKVVAEGVETRGQEDYLRAFGCDHAQGYLYARPQPAGAITDMLAAASR
jgi:diguanylate cyclase (GGDEF)-like protein/PAS domain S-box-containing protein